MLVCVGGRATDQTALYDRAARAAGTVRNVPDGFAMKYQATSKIESSLPPNPPTLNHEELSKLFLVELGYLRALERGPSLIRLRGIPCKALGGETYTGASMKVVRGKRRTRKHIHLLDFFSW